MTAQPASLHLSRCVTDRALAARVGLVLTACGLLLGILGPFGTHLLMAFGPRLAYWLATAAAIGGPIALALWAMRRHVFRDRLPWWAPLGVAVLATLPGILVVRAALSHWAPDALQHVGTAELACQILLLNLLGVGIDALGRRLRAGSAPAAETTEPGPVSQAQAALPPPAGPGLGDRLPAALARARLLALQAEDHYLRVHTTAGETLIHMRLSEAVLCLGGVEGMQVHRSHWVARSALAGSERRDGRLFLRLEGGGLVPVSRSFRNRVLAAGWLTESHEPVKKI